MERHVIELGVDGSVKVSVDGVKGKACYDATKAIEKALGKTVQDTKTREFYEQEKQGERARAGN